MRNYLAACLVACLHLFVLTASATDSTTANVKLIFGQQRISDKEVLLSIKALVAPGIKLYGLQKTAADALYSTITFDSVAGNYTSGKVEERGIAKTEKDPSVD